MRVRVRGLGLGLVLTVHSFCVHSFHTPPSPSFRSAALSASAPSLGTSCPAVGSTWQLARDSCARRGCG